MVVDSLPSFSVRELNEAIGTLLERGFAPRFLLHGSVLRSQLKKGHLWITLSDGDASITAVVWASQLKKLGFIPKETDGVVIVGKLNFWQARANLIVQVFDIKPTLSTVIRQFEIVSSILREEGLLDPARHRQLPKHPSAIGILTSVPSSALADMLRTAKERWPLTKLFVISIPVQGNVAKKIQSVLTELPLVINNFGIEAIVLARGGGNREDLMVFDDEKLCRSLATFPIPVITGLGHEDDLTVADLVADYRAATPTAAIVSLLPSREVAKDHCLERKQRLNDHINWLLLKEKKGLEDKRKFLTLDELRYKIQKKREMLDQKYQLLNALSPEKWLLRGFSILTNSSGQAIRSIKNLSRKELLNIKVSDGTILAIVDKIDSKGLKG